MKEISSILSDCSNRFVAQQGYTYAPFNFLSQKSIQNIIHYQVMVFFIIWGNDQKSQKVQKQFFTFDKYQF